jgi:hypothetical protein
MLRIRQLNGLYLSIVVSTSPLRAVASIPLSDFHGVSRAGGPKGQLTKCSSRNCFLLKTIHFDGGVWGTFRSRTFRRSNVQTLQRFLNLSPLFHTLGHSFALFCTPQKLNSFLFKRFRTLRQKTQPPRVGERGTNLTPCVSRTREIRPGQSGSLNAFNRTRDTGHIAQLSFRPETCWPCSDWGGLKST